MERQRYLQIHLGFLHGELNQAPRDLFGIRGCSDFMPSRSRADFERFVRSDNQGNSTESRLDLKRHVRNPAQTDGGATSPRLHAGSFFSQ
jgi:hypothetical protein